MKNLLTISAAMLLALGLSACGDDDGEGDMNQQPPGQGGMDQQPPGQGGGMNQQPPGQGGTGQQPPGQGMGGGTGQNQ